MLVIRKAEAKDIKAISEIYELIHDEEAKGNLSVGWTRGVYPTEATAQAAFERGELFVGEDEGEVIGSYLINHNQMDSYKDGTWECKCADEDIMVAHTLVINPNVSGRGYGRAFMDFYESYSREQGAKALRIDTQEKNLVARKLYGKVGYKEVGIVPCDFNGIPGISLVLLEKKL